MDSYHQKKQLLLDIEEAEKFKELNVELMEHLSFTVNWILDYCEKNNLQPPNIEKLLNITKKCRELFERMNVYYSPPNFTHPNGTPMNQSIPT
jgi:hypothetical protein